MLINLSNHPMKNWSEKQITEAKRLFGEIYDMPFPSVAPLASEGEVRKIAEKYRDICVKKIRESNDRKNAVHLMGEFTFVYILVTMLKKKNITCIASTSERNVSEIGGNKIVKFDFVRFREY